MFGHIYSLSRHFLVWEKRISEMILFRKLAHSKTYLFSFISVLSDTKAANLLKGAGKKIFYLKFLVTFIREGFDTKLLDKHNDDHAINRVFNVWSVIPLRYGIVVHVLYTLQTLGKICYHEGPRFKSSHGHFFLFHFSVLWWFWN